MASWMIHLRVADLLMDRIPGLDEVAFVMGNIAPDSGIPNADWTAYFPPKAVSHYKTQREDETFFDIGRFLKEHFTAGLIRACSQREFSFFLGYYVHLLTDADWTLNIYRPMIAEYVEKRGEDKNTFIWKMKRDWYDLDFRYLEGHPDFRAFNIYEQASGFINDFMDIFSKDAFDNRREYICGFYRGQHGELYRDYPYLSPAQADAFVEKTVESILPNLESILAVRNEENTLQTQETTASPENALNHSIERMTETDLKKHSEHEAGINDGATVKNQYRTADRLNTRISVHSKYSTNKQGFGNWITSHYQIRDGASVLELGCGTGDMWLGKDAIISRCGLFVLSDFSEGMLTKAKETLHNQTGIEYRQIDIQDIPFADHTFDVVIANMMLYHVPNLHKALLEVKRVLKEDGAFYCATYGEHGMMDYICSLFADYQVQNHINDSFTLQNGEKKLKSVFSDVQKLLYEDSLRVTDVDDMVDYIYSLTGMTDLQKLPGNEVKSVLEKNMREGILYVPKEYGMFIARK